jgi:hypothetical protein
MSVNPLLLLTALPLHPGTLALEEEVVVEEEM